MKLIHVFSIAILILVIILAFKTCSNQAEIVDKAEQIAKEWKTLDSTKNAQIEMYATMNESLSDEIKVLKGRLTVQSAIINQIPTKYEKVRDSISKLSDDDKLRFFSGWLNEARQHHYEE